MRLTDHAYAFPVTFEMMDREMTINPSGVETDDGLLLLDVGVPGGAADLAAALDEHGFALSDVEAVMLTHQDLDHAGCLATVVEESGATVYAHEADADYVEGERDPIKGGDGSMQLETAPVDVRLVGGETFRTAAGPLEVVHTPGHTPGHCSLFLRDAGLLFAADALNVVDGELVGPREDATPDVASAWESVETLSALDVAEVFCFHGGAVEADADAIAALR